MTRLLLKLPWFISAPAIALVAAVAALGLNYAGSEYFERSFLDEASPLVTGGDQLEVLDANPTPGGQPTAATPAPPEGGVIARGTFRDGAPGHNGEGTALLIRTAEGKHVLRFEDFSVTNGPDLFVVLSTDHDGYSDDGLTLDGLRATDGNINYDVPDGTDLAKYKSVVIWCQQFSTLFAYATLEPA